VTEVTSRTTKVQVSTIVAVLERLKCCYRDDLLAKNCLFFTPLSYSAPSLPMFPLECCGEVNHEETEVMGLSSSEDRIIVAGVVLT